MKSILKEIFFMNYFLLSLDTNYTLVEKNLFFFFLSVVSFFVFFISVFISITISLKKWVPNKILVSKLIMKEISVQ